MEKQRGFLLFPILCFVICFLLVGWNNRFASDDFEFLNKLREYGYLGSVKWFHEHWNTRWASIGILNGVFLFTLNIRSLIWYHLLSLFFLWFGFYRIIKNLNSQGKFMDGILAGYASIAFFYACFSISDVFYWVNTSTMYLYGCIAFLFAVGEITSRHHSVSSYLRLACFSIFIAGAYEPLVFSLMVGCVVVLFFLVKKHGWNVWRISFDKKLIIFLSGLMLGFAISYSGEGHVVRATFLPQTDIYFKLLVWVKALIKMFGIFLPAKLLPALLFSFPWFVIALSGEFSWLTPRMMKIVTLVFVLLVMISLLPISFIMSEMGPERAWTQVSVYTVIFSAFVAMYGGNRLKRKYSMHNVLRIYVVVSFLYIIATGIPSVIQAYSYRSAYDKRLGYILDQKDDANKQLLILKPLPPPGWLHSAELDRDPGHFNNVFVKNYFRLDFDITVQ